MKIKHIIIVLGMLLSCGACSTAQVSTGIAEPGVSIGINLQAYPELDIVPGYPVYYAPQLDANYFFYDGMYWVFQIDNWYASSWYNGPLGACKSWGCAGVRAAGPCALLPAPSCLFPRVGVRCAAPLG